jgi:hypothetical protein
MNKVIIALDFPGSQQALSFLDGLEGERPFVKVGMELFYATGPGFILDLKERGHDIFLDLKLHDIPNTVQRAMAVLAGLGVDMLNVHAAGTVKMMAAAREGRFHIYPVKTIDQGIEILTDVPAGERRNDGGYPPGTVNFLVDRKLRELAEGLKRFGEKESGAEQPGEAPHGRGNPPAEKA